MSPIPSLTSFAMGVLAADTVDAKWSPPPVPLDALTDADRTLPIRVDEPTRPPGLAIVEGGRARTPPLTAMHDPAQRVRILHSLANHELQAAELFAWAILAFPDAPPRFRRGCLAILCEEQAHGRLYCARIEAMGSRFGAFPVNGHFWRKVPSIRTPLQFVCTMGLTFENANLDFALEHAAAARAAGDEETAAVLDRVHRDETGHVRFAWEHLLLWKRPDETPWDCYVRNVAPPHGPQRARGATFDRDCRRAAGLDEDFVARLAATEPERPGGARR
ncbi:MAG: hypothetical protein HMLKMBBP_02493 [Planctomycetes bacterium]|nr:hypothetical protein [Planctomycetota bacterium]